MIKDPGGCYTLQEVEEVGGVPGPGDRRGPAGWVGSGLQAGARGFLAPGDLPREESSGTWGQVGSLIGRLCR